jgi:hypothetical protein
LWGAAIIYTVSFPLVGLERLFMGRRRGGAAAAFGVFMHHVPYGMSYDDMIKRVKKEGRVGLCKDRGSGRLLTRGSATRHDAIRCAR